MVDPRVCLASEFRAPVNGVRQPGMQLAHRYGLRGSIDLAAADIYEAADSDAAAGFEKRQCARGIDVMSLARCVNRVPDALARQMEHDIDPVQRGGHSGVLQNRSDHELHPAKARHRIRTPRGKIIEDTYRAGRRQLLDQSGSDEPGTTSHQDLAIGHGGPRSMHRPLSATDCQVWTIRTSRRACSHGSCGLFVLSPFSEGRLRSWRQTQSEHIITAESALGHGQAPLSWGSVRTWRSLTGIKPLVRYSGSVAVLPG